MEYCKICGAKELSLKHQGFIRDGKFGCLTPDARKIYQCGGCATLVLHGDPVDYETDSYRESVNGDSQIETYHSIHDKEAIRHLSSIGTQDLRGKTVVEVGCGGGSLLDLVKGLSCRTIAIDPCKAYHPQLKKKGHVVYSFSADAIEKFEGSVDMVISMAVIEHIEDPKQFLQEIHSLLKPDGILVIGTPNSNDILLDILPEEYAKFFYRVVHRWYFSAGSLGNLGELTGFRTVNVKHVHRYDFANFLTWVRDKKPSGLGNIVLPSMLNKNFQTALEHTGKSDFFYTTFVKS